MVTNGQVLCAGRNVEKNLRSEIFFFGMEYCRRRLVVRRVERSATRSTTRRAEHLADVAQGVAEPCATSAVPAT